jgi:perosamine synthetase
MPMYSTQYQRHPVAENLGWRGLNLPSYPGLKTEEIEFISKEINNFFANK